jgi:hypothetical protein
MSFNAAVEKLNPSVKELVIAVTDNGVRHVGQTEKDQAEVTEWIEKASQPDIATEASLQVCNTREFHPGCCADKLSSDRASTRCYFLEHTLSTSISQLRTLLYTVLCIPHLYVDYTLSSAMVYF